MEWHKTDVQGLAVIDAEIEGYKPAQYEIIRQVIYATADFEYKDLIQFSDQALEKGSAAIAARTSIVVDVASLQMAITSTLQSTFANASYICTSVITRPQKQKSQAAWGMETLAQRYPSAIFVIGESQSALEALTDMIATQNIAPALVIATPAEFINIGVAKSQLQHSNIPYILINGQKGGAMVAAKVLTALISLAWEVYGTKDDF